MLLVKLRKFFSAHPLLFLILLAPQVEYFTGSSQLSWLVGSPPLFFLLLFQNLGSYGLAVVLIREARIRWKKGWASILLLGAAYGILNEGIGAATLFNPDTTAFGDIGSYGRLFGVNWVWATGLVLLVHPLFSVSLPIIEHRLTLPAIRGKSLLSPRGIELAIVGLAIDGVATLLFVATVRGYYAGPLLWAGSCVAMGLLILAARLVSTNRLRPLTALPRVHPAIFFVLGVLFVWTANFGGAILGHLNAPPALVALFFIALGGLSLLWVFRNIGQNRNELQLVTLTAGLVASLLPMGLFSQLGTGIGILPVAAIDLLAIVFFGSLWKKYSS